MRLFFFHFSKCFLSNEYLTITLIRKKLLVPKSHNFFFFTFKQKLRKYKLKMLLKIDSILIDL